MSSEDGTAVACRPTALDDVVAEAPQGIDFLAGEVEIVMNDEDASHVTPPRCASSGPGGPGIEQRWSRRAGWPSGEGHLPVGHLARGIRQIGPNGDTGFGADGSNRLSSTAQVTSE